MNRNPFVPSFGVTPRVVAGRDAVVAQVGIALREGAGSPYRFTLIQGARGSGKTVLLNLLEEEARQAGWRVIRVPAAKDMLTDLRDSELPHVLRDLGQKPSREIVGGSIAGVGSIETKINDSHTSAPSLRRLLHQTCSLLDKAGSGLFLTMDELQSASPEDLHLLTDAVQNSVRDLLPVALSVAGLPFEIAELLDLPGTTFLRRSVPVELGAITDGDVSLTLQETAKKGGREFTADALDFAVGLVQGYPYLLQLLGSVAFSLTEGPVITKDVVESAEPLIKQRIGLQVHQPALRGVPSRELEYLQTMRLIGTPTLTSTIAEKMGIPANQQSTYRRRLMERGLIVPASFGKVRFALPYMEDYLGTIG